MSFLGTLALIAAGAGATGLAVVKTKEWIEDKVFDYKMQEQMRHEEMVFSGKISRDKFIDIVQECKEGIPRLKSLTVKGTCVRGVVDSISGLTEWGFSIDFDDLGSLTGNYRIFSDNSDSVIPAAVAKRIKKAIQNY